MEIISKEQAAGLIRDGASLAMTGFVGNGHSETLSSACEERFRATGHPRDLTIQFSSGVGDGKNRGANHFANVGMVKRIIGGHYGFMPRLGKMIHDELVEGYNLPQGIITHLFRAAAGRKPGVLAKVGLGTFVDPRMEGGKLNATTKEELVAVMEVGGDEYLFYKVSPIDVALIRASTADEKGNLTMEREAVYCEALSMAGAAKANGGIVIAEVERIAAKGTLDPGKVKVPGLLVDYVVVGDRDKFNQTYREYYNPAYSGEVKVPLKGMVPLPLDERKIIARRAAMELVSHSRINLGIGMPVGVASVAAEEEISDLVTFTLEAGGFGGVAADGLSFGATVNAEAMLDQAYMFDFYDGGNIDVACLGLAQVDSEGNLNVSKFGSKLAGCGGFINISQNARKVVFCGTLTSGGLKVAVRHGKLLIEQEGTIKKFVSQVEQVTFSGKYAQSIRQPVLYVTERAVFRLEQAGLVLTEIAPGIDLKRDILERIDAKVIVPPDVVVMDDGIFKAESMDLRQSFYR